MTSQQSVWRHAAVYQIYPWTFNEDKGRMPQKGHGSIKGITEKIPYLRSQNGNERKAVALGDRIVGAGYEHLFKRGETQFIGSARDEYSSLSPEERQHFVEGVNELILEYITSIEEVISQFRFE
jgi:hypothetical protein